MTDLHNAPPREQTTPAGEKPAPLIPVSQNPLPSDPGQILAQTRPGEHFEKKRPRLIVWCLCGLVAAQVFAPPPMKPTVFAGEAAAGFYSQIMAASADKEEDLARKRVLASRLADLEARWSEAKAKCFMAGLLGPEAAQLCYSAVDQNFVPAIQQVRRQLAQF